MGQRHNTRNNYYALNKKIEEDCTLSNTQTLGVLKAITSLVKDENYKAITKTLAPFTKVLGLDLGSSKALITLSSGVSSESDIVSAVDIISNQLGLDSSIVKSFACGQLKCPLLKLANFLAPFAQEFHADESLLAILIKISF